MPMLDKASILAAKDFRFEDVEVPEWGGTVRLRGLSASERDSFENEATKTGELINIRSKFIATTLIDEKGNSLFTAKEAVKLGEKDAKVINNLFEIVRKLSGMADDDLEVAQGN